MNQVKLSEIFHVKYGHSLELNRLKQVGPEGVPFVSRQMGNNGVSAFVQKIPGLEPNPAGEFTCALSGNGVLSTFLQERPYYTGFHVACLQPRIELTLNQKPFYCTCIKANRYRFSYGRQANRTIREILIPSPDDFPEWVNDVSIEDEFLEKFEKARELSSSPKRKKSETIGLQRVKVIDLFDVVYGHSLELNRLKQTENGINFVSRTFKNNGISAKVEKIAGLEPAPSGLITVSCGGSVLESFVQLEPFYCGRDMYWLIPKKPLSVEEKLFYAACIRANKFRYNYGRQANKTLKLLEVPAPESIPAWIYGSINKTISEWEKSLIA